MKQKLIYVVGPFRASCAWEIEENIRRAERLALQVWQRGAACICPHTNTRFFHGAADDSIWLRGDLEILSRCDGIILVPGWSQSAGSQAEVEYAYKLGLIVLYTLEDLDRYLTP